MLQKMPIIRLRYLSSKSFRQKRLNLTIVSYILVYVVLDMIFRLRRMTLRTTCYILYHVVTSCQPPISPVLRLIL